MSACNNAANTGAADCATREADAPPEKLLSREYRRSDANGMDPLQARLDDSTREIDRRVHDSSMIAKTTWTLETWSEVTRFAPRFGSKRRDLQNDRRDGHSPCGFEMHLGGSYM